MRVLILLAGLMLGLTACNAGYGNDGKVIWADQRNAGR